MRSMPLSIGVLHFVGIGGIGMSGIAEILHNLGYKVQGSDMAASANVKRLQKKGIKIAIGHDAANLGDARVVIVSSAVKSDNPEVAAARIRFIPVVRRAEMLAELMRLKWAIAVAGTHGKTTTTSLIAAMLDAAGMDPTVINGGIINAYGGNARLGIGEWVVAEADESDGSFMRLPASAAIVTNIDPEHLDHYGTFDKVREAFHTFVENIPFYGFAALCTDHPEVQALAAKVPDRKIVSYGFNQQADIRAANVTTSLEGVTFDVAIAEHGGTDTRMIEGLRLPMYGRHNIQNALAAIAVADQLGMSNDIVRRALQNFSGVKRRFTLVGSGAGIMVIDDYGHHPVEIASVLRAARDAAIGSVIAVVQPHRYSRLASLFTEFTTCFNDADTVIVADVYPAGEQPIEGADKEHLAAGLVAAGHRNVLTLDDPANLAELLRSFAKKDDMVVCLGAGNITNWAQILPAQLDALSKGLPLPVEAAQ